MINSEKLLVAAPSTPGTSQLSHCKVLVGVPLLPIRHGTTSCRLTARASEVQAHAPRKRYNKDQKFFTNSTPQHEQRQHRPAPTHTDADTETDADKDVKVSRRTLRKRAALALVTRTDVPEIRSSSGSNRSDRACPGLPCPRAAWSEEGRCPARARAGRPRPGPASRLLSAKRPHLLIGPRRRTAPPT